MEVETRVHIFCNGDTIQKSWQDLFEYIRDKCNIPYIPLTVRDIMFGHANFYIVLTKIILQAKSCIYKYKFTNNLPTLPNVLSHV